MKYYAAGFVYSVGMTPMNTAGAMSSLTLMQENHEHVEQLRDISTYFLSRLKTCGFDTGKTSGHAIIPILLGSSSKAAQLSDSLFKRHKINVNPVMYPAVEEKRARLRFFLNSYHTKEQIDYTVAALQNEKSGF